MLAFMMQKYEYKMNYARIPQKIPLAGVFTDFCEGVCTLKILNLIY